MNSIESGVPRRDKNEAKPDPKQDQEQVKKNSQEQILAAELQAANLTELGWRDRPGIATLLRDLEQFAASNWQRAANLWEKYRPDDPDKPQFIDGDDKDPETSDSTQAKKKPDPINTKATPTEPEFTPPASLQKRYLVAGSKYYFRHDPKILAFEDKGKRLTTAHEVTGVAKSMVELAQAKGWACIRVKGSSIFRQEAWLAAALKDIEVFGYQPSDVDRARLQELRDEAKPHTQNAIEQGFKRNPSQSQEPARSTTPPRTRSPSKELDTPALSERQQLAVDTLKAILKERGDSDTAIQMAAQMAAERFRHRRVYVGKLIDHGMAPFEHNPDKTPSYFVTLTTPAGEKTIWGIDFQRALTAGQVRQGDEISIINRTVDPATHWEREYGSNGKPTGRLLRTEGHRNGWIVEKLDALRQDVAEKLKTAKERQVHGDPVIKVYDRNAPRERWHEQSMPGEATPEREPKQSVQR